MQLGHVPVLDAIRGIAIALVLVVHADHVLDGGLLGVDLFFVLSGFLITSLLLGEWEREGRVSFSGFYRRRALRLLPALVVMLAVVTAAMALAADDFGGQGVWVLYSLGYVVNVASVREDGIGATSLEHMWSLSQEEQFYLVWPLLLVGLLRAGVRPRSLALLLGAGALALVGYRVALADVGAPVGYLWYAPESRSLGLVLGCLAAVVFTYKLVRRIPLWLPTALLVPAVVAVLVLDLWTRWHALYLLPLFCLAATTIVLACVLHPEWWFARLVNRAWLRGLGRISYGLYLWHWPIYFVVGWKLGLPLAIAVALLSYRFVEQPFLRRRHSRRQPEAPPRREEVAPATA